MRWNIRRFVPVLLGVAAAAGLASLDRPSAEAQTRKKQEQAQQGQLGAAPRGEAAASQVITLPTDPALKKKFDAIPDYLKEELWPEAVRSLQSLLEIREDVFFPLARPGTDGKEVVQWRSVRAEANHLLGTLPPAALEFYEVSFGQQAKALLAEARNDPHLLAQVMQRYFHTQAGAEATARLANHHLDRGRYFLAALCFERYLERVGSDKLSAAELFRAALAFHRAGDRANAERTWKRLGDRAADGLRLGERKVSLAELEKALGRPGEQGTDPGGGRTWAMFRGGPARLARAAAGAPVDELRWTRSLFQDATAQSWLLGALLRQEQRGQAALPGAFPIVSGGRIVCRTPRGLWALDAATGATLWEAPSEGGLEPLRSEPDHAAYVNQWAAAHLEHSPAALLENSILGTLSSDGSQVFAVDDLAVPPAPHHYAGFAGRQGQGLRLAFAPELTDAVYHNRLRAIDLETGKLAWEVGGRARKEVAGINEADAPLLDCFFLGPPLPLAGKLYVLAEKNQELRLVCLDAARGEIAWTQLLATAQKKLLLDGARRVHAAHLAVSEGVLVCPTNAGALVGVDLLTQSLLWAHIYQEEPPKPELPPGRGRAVRTALKAPEPPPCDADWHGSAPLLADGKIVYGAPDAPALFCLNLRDGSPRWTRKSSAQDLYVAGIHQDKVIVVTKQGVQALSLDTGKELWKVEVGLPSGHGVAAGNIYYVPVKADARNRQPAIWAVDLDRGTLLGATPTPNDEVPGNLVFADGQVFSQTPTQLTAYPQAPKQ
jgi:outer membrane protein assembly factor BamB